MVRAPARRAYPSFQFALLDFIHRDGHFLPHAGTWWGRDFTNLYFGGRFAVAEGINVYDQAAYLPALREQGILAGQNYSYPPATLAIGFLLSLLPYVAALLLWSLAGLACFLVAARRYINFPWPWLLLLPATVPFPNGQWGLFVAALWLWSFAGSGSAAGLLTMKPHLGILLAPALAFKRRWRQMAVAVAVTLLIWLSAEWAFGLTRSYLTVGAETQMAILTTRSDQPFFSAMPSTYAALRLFPFAWWAHAAVAVASLALLWGLRQQPLIRLAFPLATASFLVLPYGFAYDMAVVSLGFLTLLHTRWGDLTWPSRAMAIGGYLSVAFPQAAPVLLLAGLWVQRQVLRSLPRPAED
ncbi:MAG: DUF2029 domain-containing protein [Pseudomonadota bacterium]|nr:DUF2029 domain-containing protein [Pseudomonadota bacterium]